MRYKSLTPFVMLLAMLPFTAVTASESYTGYLRFDHSSLTTPPPPGSYGSNRPDAPPNFGSENYSLPFAVPPQGNYQVNNVTGGQSWGPGVYTFDLENHRKWTSESDTARIVQVSEPSSVGLLITGGLIAIFAVRRRSRGLWIRARS
jgi:hypothetical protein